MKTPEAGEGREQRQQKLDQLLAKIQKEDSREAFIYGVTNRANRGVFDRINDFLIDHSPVPVREKAYIFELLATMLHAGIPVNRALKILISKTENQRLRRVIATLSYELEHGWPLSHALDKFPEVFDESMRGAIRSAEAVGNLEQMLFKIAATLERQNDLQSRLVSALVYPIMVVAALLIGITVMLVFVVPRLESIFAESALTLPLPTRILLGTSLFVSKTWWLLLILLIFAGILGHMYTSSEEGRFSWDFQKLRIPFFGVILRKMYVVRFVETLGILIESGLPINKALELTAEGIGNEIYRLKVYEALGRVQQGSKLSETCATAPFLFPETVTNMIAVGEYSATLGSISQKLGSHFEREIDHTLKNLTTVLGPAMILVIGLLVAFFAIAVLSPIFTLTQSVA